MSTRVGRITQRQAEMGGYTMPSTPVAPTNESDADDDDTTTFDDEDDGDASSPNNGEMST